MSLETWQNKPIWRETQKKLSHLDPKDQVYVKLLALLDQQSINLKIIKFTVYLKPWALNKAGIDMICFVQHNKTAVS